MTSAPRIEQALRFECRQPSDRKPLKELIYVTLGGITGFVLSALLNEGQFDATGVIGFIAAMAIYELALSVASRSRTTITIQNGVVTIQTGSLVYGSFALADIAKLEPNVTLKSSVLPGPVEASTVTTKSNLVFHVPTGRLAPEDRGQLLSLLSFYAQPD